MTLAQFLTELRKDLRDTGSDRWTDSELTRHVQHAIQDYSYACPLEQSDNLATVSDSRQVDISSLAPRVTVFAFEWPKSRWPSEFLRFSVFGDTLTFDSGSPGDGTDATAYWGKTHTLDAGTDTIPDNHKRLVYEGAAAYALLDYASYTINQANVGGTDVARRYQDEGVRRLERFRKDLKQLGRQNRVRIKSLYTPARPPVSKFRVSGP
jgi:hypothetical protein